MVVRVLLLGGCFILRCMFWWSLCPYLGWNARFVFPPSSLGTALAQTWLQKIIFYAFVRTHMFWFYQVIKNETDQHLEQTWNFILHVVIFFSLSFGVIRGSGWVLIGLGQGRIPWSKGHPPLIKAPLMEILGVRLCTNDVWIWGGGHSSFASLFLWRTCMVSGWSISLDLHQKNCIFILSYKNKCVFSFEMCGPKS